MRLLRRWLFRVARTPWMGGVVGWVFAHMSFLIPVERLRDTPTLVAFYHPKPSHKVHVLIVPKKVVGSMLDLDASDSAFLVEMFATVQALVDELGIRERGYSLVTNGGLYQDVKQLHFHLISD